MVDTDSKIGKTSLVGKIGKFIEHFVKTLAAWHNSKKNKSQTLSNFGRLVLIQAFAEIALKISKFAPKVAEIPPTIGKLALKNFEIAQKICFGHPDFFGRFENRGND